MIEIRIAFDPANGAMKIDGPVNDRVLFYGLLDLAKDVVRSQALEARRVVPVTGDVLLPPPPLNGHHKG